MLRCSWSYRVSRDSSCVICQSVFDKSRDKLPLLGKPETEMVQKRQFISTDKPTICGNITGILSVVEKVTAGTHLYRMCNVFGKSAIPARLHFVFDRRWMDRRFSPKFSWRRRTRATRCITLIVPYTKEDGHLINSRRSYVVDLHLYYWYTDVFWN